ncbi:MAG: M56 family metallopeptidase [Defluviitaleaceae bacterium]|nr:M56 family metallopeptidase [Defluviitaleaceae bacterium]
MGQFFLSFLISSFVMGLIILVVMLLRRLFPKVFTPHLRYFVWVVILIGLVIPFRPIIGGGLFGLQMPANHTTNQSIVNQEFLFGQEQMVGGGEQILITTTQPLSLWDVLAIIWFGVAVAILLFHIWRYIRFWGLIKRWGADPSNATEELLKSMLSNMELSSKNIRLKVCGFVSTSMIVGFARPTILLPHDDFATEELELIFCHELVHHRRGDLFIKLLSVVAASLNWFNPAVYLMNKVKQADCEASCDQAVMAKMGNEMDNRQFYAEIIMDMIGDKRSKKTALSTCFYSSKGGLRQRMEAVMSADRPARKVAFVLPALVIGVMVFSGSVFVVSSSQPVEFMGRGDALEILIAHMNVNLYDLNDLIIEEEWVGNHLSWEFYFTLEGQRLNKYVNAVTGQVSEPNLRINMEQAVDAFLRHQGATNESVRVLDGYISIFGGALVWDVVIEVNGTTSEFHVDIYTSEVLNVEVLDFLP